VKAFFKQKYGKSGEFGADSAALLMAQMRKFISLFTLMLGAVAMITLSVGGMGINNMMLVSIAERLKEIGLRKALGATNRSVRAQFLLESVFLCVLAGIAGILLGFTLYEVIIYVASKFVPKLTFELVIDPVALTASLFSIVVVGIASGIIPAIKAERLEVIEAMRTE
jgi:ABC-type antimicrobial peptide transport system permease subunit